MIGSFAQICKYKLDNLYNYSPTSAESKWNQFQIIICRNFAENSLIQLK